MAQTIDIDAIRKLSTTERLALIARIWDTLAEDDDVPVSQGVLDEMDRRAAELDADPSSGIPYAEMMKRLRSKKWRAS
ncbi:MAG: addiction module protein [Planctomycetes bacterium]|nr:addiction module protein [Planctomycetota bacterium]MCA8935276.1 addiction module protein [Planctomycetota bacterium]